MKKVLGAALATAIVAGSMSHAAVVSATGAIVEISAPVSVTNAGPGSNTTMMVFNEAQNLVLSSALDLGSFTIAAGTKVNSHMLFLNQETGKSLLQLSGSLVFDGMILGLVSSTAKLLATDSIFGAIGTTYENFKFRGLEKDDVVSYSDNSLDAALRVTQPGDWVRIITLAPAPVPVPVPASGFLVISALGALAALRRRFAKQA